MPLGINVRKNIDIVRVARSKKKVREFFIFFQVRGRSGNLFLGQGILRFCLKSGKSQNSEKKKNSLTIS